MGADATAARMPDASPAGWRERLIGWRNRLIADPRFQRFAAGNLFTRGVARRDMRALFDLCAGFVYSQTLLACVRVDAFEALRDGARPLDDLARSFSLPRDSALRLLRAGVSLRLFRALPRERFALGDLGAAMLGNPSIAGFVEHHRLLYDDLRDPLALLRGETQTKLSQFWPYDDAAPESVRAYSQLMARSQELIAQDALEAFPLEGRRRLMDVGGGDGEFLVQAARRAPHLELTLFDLPAVAERARLRFESLRINAQAIGGDFLLGDLPPGADIVSFIRVLHDHDDGGVMTLLRAAHRALPEGGAILVAEPFAQTPGAEPIGDAYFGFYLLAMGGRTASDGRSRTGPGRARSAAELCDMMRRAGFRDIRALKTRRPLLTGALIGKRGAAPARAPTVI